MKEWQKYSSQRLGVTRLNSKVVSCTCECLMKLCTWTYLHSLTRLHQESTMKNGEGGGNGARTANALNLKLKTFPDLQGWVANLIACSHFTCTYTLEAYLHIKFCSLHTISSSVALYGSPCILTMKYLSCDPWLAASPTPTRRKKSSVVASNTYGA